MDYFIADDAFGDTALWKGDREGECSPVIYRMALDREDRALWPALLAGLGVQETSETGTAVTK